MLAFGMCAQARVTPVLLWDIKEVRPTFSEDWCVLQFLVTAGGEANDEGVQRWEMNSRIPDYLPGSPAETLPAILYNAKYFVPAKFSQSEYDTVNMMQRCRTWQVLCLCVPFALSFSPGVHLQNDREPLGWESVWGSLVWLWGPACPHLSLLRKQKDLDTQWVKQDLKKLFCHSQWTLKIVHGKQLYRLLKCKKLTENLLWTF